MSIAAITISIGQSEFHRTYALVENNHVVMDAVGSEGGNTYTVAGLLEDVASDTYPYLVVTSFNNKGDVNWATSVYSSDSTSFEGLAAIERGFDGRLYVLASIDQDQENVGLYVLEDRGVAGIETVTSYILETDMTAAGFNRLELAPDSTLLLGTKRLDDGSVSLLKVDPSGELLWSRLLSNTNTQLEDVSNILMRQDSIAQVSTTAGSDAIQLLVDSTGAVAAGHRLSTSDGRNLRIHDAVDINDSVTCVVGILGETFFSAEGFVALVENQDSVYWAAQTAFDATNSLGTFYHVDASQGSIRVFGEVTGSFNEVFVLDLDINTGEELAHYVVDSAIALSPLLPSGGLVPRESGYTYVGTTVRDNALQHNIIRLNSDLLTGCSSTSDVTFLDPLSLSIEPFMATSTEEGNIDSSNTTAVVYQRFAIPVLSLRDTVVCGNLPFAKVYDAIQEDAISYLWTLADGSESTDSVIVATEVGQYIVEIEMGGDVCYKLCDTVNIHEYQQPQVSISLNTDGLCEDPPFVSLNAGFDVDATPFDLAWEDGSTNPLRQIDVDGDYSVTVTDVCEVSVQDQVSYTFPPPFPTAIQIVDPGMYCDDDRAIIDLLVVDQDGTPLSPELQLLSGGQATLNPLQIAKESLCDITYVIELVTPCPEQLIDSIKLNSCTCFRWPLLFFPNGQTSDVGVDNRSFLPVSKCTDIEDYELHIYNRWGNEVFEGNNFESGWNGRFDGEDAPQGVYVWWARYSSGGQEFTDRGDVTLLR